MANQIRDFQAELELANPTATLSLSEMVSKLLSKLRDPKFQMLRFQIAEWEEKRLSSATATLSSSFGSLLSSALTASVASVGSLTSGGGGAGGGFRSSSSSSSSTVEPRSPPPWSCLLHRRCLLLCNSVPSLTLFKNFDYPNLPSIARIPSILSM